MYEVKNLKDRELELEHSRLRVDNMSMGGESSHAQPNKARGIRQTPKIASGKMAWIIRERRRLEALGFTVDPLPTHYVDREQIAAKARARTRRWPLRWQRQGQGQGQGEGQVQ